MVALPAAVVLHELAAPHDPELEAALGERLAAALREDLAARARRWAALVAPDHAFEATTVGAAEVAVHGHDGPVLLVAPDVPRLDAELARLALADLADGALVVMGPTTDGTPYLVAVPSAAEGLAHATAPFERLAQDARLAHAGVGMLRAERRLASLPDAHAFAADPVADAGLLAHLAPLLGA